MLHFLTLIELIAATLMPGAVLYDEVMLKYTAKFDDAFNMVKANQEILPYLLPVIEIKSHCGLTKTDVWPLHILNLHGTLNQHCLELLNNHSHIYKAATVTIPAGVPLSACRTVELLKPNILTIIFPDYNQYGFTTFQQQQSEWNSVNSVQLNLLMDRIQENKRVSLIMRQFEY